MVPSSSSTSPRPHLHPEVEDLGTTPVELIMNTVDGSLDAALRRRRIDDLFETCLQHLQGWHHTPGSTHLTPPKRLGLVDLDALIETLLEVRSQHLEVSVGPVDASAARSLTTLDGNLARDLIITTATGSS